MYKLFTAVTSNKRPLQAYFVNLHINYQTTTRALKLFECKHADSHLHLQLNANVGKQEFEVSINAL